MLNRSRPVIKLEAQNKVDSSFDSYSSFASKINLKISRSRIIFTDCYSIVNWPNCTGG
jgi:hypothetical protein